MLKKDNIIPNFAQFNAAAIGDIWPNCIVFEVLPGVENQPPNLSAQTIGSNLRSIYANEMLGKAFNATHSHFRNAKIMEHTQDVITAKMHALSEGQYVNDNNKIVKFRACLLPFGNKDAKVTHILVGLSWREY